MTDGALAYQLIRKADSESDVVHGKYRAAVKLRWSCGEAVLVIDTKLGTD